jgi:hypothetical protein
MNRYAIWDKVSPIITPIGEVLSAEQWIARYPVAGIPSITVVCGGGEINGSFFGTLGQMIDMAKKEGCEIPEDLSPEEKLAIIEVFEEEREAHAQIAAKEAAELEAARAERNVVALEAIASSQTAESTAAMNALLNGEE